MAQYLPYLLPILIIVVFSVILFLVYKRFQSRVKVYAMKSKRYQQRLEEVQRTLVEREEVVASLQESAARYRDLFENASDLIQSIDADGRFVFVNQSWIDVMGYTIEEAQGLYFTDILHPAEIDHCLSIFEQLQQGHNVDKMETVFITKSGKAINVEGNLNARMEAGKFVSSRGLFRDITDRKIVEENLRRTAQYDTLTNLPNRITFMERLKEAIQRAEKAPNYMFAVLFLDLDRFKLVNDTLGHLAGDQLLITVARRLEDCIRVSDMAARLGGDEFLVFLDNLQNQEAAVYVCEKILSSLLVPVIVGDDEIFTGTSIGMVLGPGSYEQPEAFLRDADTALYQAKSQGRGQYVLFDKQMYVRMLERVHLENELRQALVKRELEVYYQPIISLTTGQITAVEAFLRWNHPQRGLLSAADFISVAEESRLIIPLGDWLLEKACHQLLAWHEAGYTSLRMSVNLSSRQLQQQNLVELVDKVLAETQLDSSYLELEITENIAERNRDYISDVLSQLSAKGVQTAIDDFGTGNASLEYLRSLSLNTLKIDRSYLENIVDDESRAMIVVAMVNLARNLNLKVVAVGVENELQLAFVRAQNCDEVQGYLLSKPIPSVGFTKLLESDPVYLSPRRLDADLELTMNIQARQNVGHALVDLNLNILTHNNVFMRWFEMEGETLVGNSLLDVFPELFGLEEVLFKLAQNQAEPLTVSKIFRSWREEGERQNEFGRYFDLHIGSFFASEDTVLLVTLTDVTQHAMTEHNLRQERNELRLNVRGRG